jgi:hypothetical protein
MMMRVRDIGAYNTRPDQLTVIAAPEWAVQRARYMSLENIAPLSDYPPVSLPPSQPDTAVQPAKEQRPTPRSGTRSRRASECRRECPAKHGLEH